jgi:hypothetical protein
LRSGGAPGADQAFERGARRVGGRVIVYRPGIAEVLPDAFDRAEAFRLAEKFHPNWDACDAYARSCLARNALIVLGPHLDTPAKVLMCWTKDGKVCGGTGHAIRIAEAHGVKVRNLAIEHVRYRVCEWARGGC